MSDRPGTIDDRPPIDLRPEFASGVDLFALPEGSAA
jgi:hypothetical protein